MRVLLLSIKKNLSVIPDLSVCLSVCLDMDMDMMECGGYTGTL